MSTKYCVNCKHHVIYVTKGLVMNAQHCCKGSTKIDLVTGKKVGEMSCSIARMDHNCGETGKWFKAKGVK